MVKLYLQTVEKTIEMCNSSKIYVNGKRMYGTSLIVSTPPRSKANLIST